MNNDCWNLYYKLSKHGKECESNLLYTPSFNTEKNILCMHFCKNLEYQPNSNATDEVITYFFNREVKYLQELKDFPFTPEIYYVDYENQKIFIEWNKETLSQIVNDPNRSLDNEIIDWKEQLYNILDTLISNSYYKMALYPHCFFVDKNKKIKTIDFYSVVPFADRYVERRKIESIIGEDSLYRFDEATVGYTIDFGIFFKITVQKHLTDSWLENPFEKIYDKLE